MSPAKPEIAHWGGGALPDKFGTSDNPQTRKGKFISVDQVPDSGLNPEEELLAKEAGEIKEEPEYNSPELAVGSYDTERAVRRRNEEEAGWSPEHRVASVESLPDGIGAERIQKKHDEEILIGERNKKMKTDKFIGQGQIPRTDKYKDVRKGKTGRLKKAA